MQKPLDWNLFLDERSIILAVEPGVVIYHFLRFQSNDFSKGSTALDLLYQCPSPHQDPSSTIFHLEISQRRQFFIEPILLVQDSRVRIYE